MPPGLLSQVPGAPTFRSASCNAVAVIPLLGGNTTGGGDNSSSRNHDDDNDDSNHSDDHNAVIYPGDDDDAVVTVSNPHTQRSYNDFIESLQRYCNEQQTKQQQQQQATATTSTTTTPGDRRKNDDLVVVVPCNNLSKPGDWRYDQTPLTHFSFNHGCIRLQVFDGRPDQTRMAHDRLLNHQLREYADLEPSRRTAAVVGVLNIRDCTDGAETLRRAELELDRWAERYATPPYSVTAHGRDYDRDHVVKRLYVFDSFHESNVIKDLSQTVTSATGSNLVAFPPSEMLDLHVSNVVLNDLAVAIFRSLELKIKQSDALTQESDGVPNATNKSRFFGNALSSSLTSSSKTSSSTEPDSPQGSADGPVSINNLASVVSPSSKLAPVGTSAVAAASSSSSKRSMSIATKLQNVTKNKTKMMGASSEAQLLTPLDEFWDYSELSPKDSHEMMKREVARREKYAADLSLLAGSPLDAYERYTKAADLCKTTCPDPLWYASAVEGIASAHVAMAECGGFEVDKYLEASFQLPDDLMACAVISTDKDTKRNTNTSTNKQNMPAVIAALCEDALDIISRNAKLACFHAELCLKLAWYVAEVEDVHIRCQWGLGEGCYGGGDADRTALGPTGGDTGGGSGGDYSAADKQRWEMASATHLNFLDWKNKDGEDVIEHNTLKRCQKWTEYMHMAASTGALDPVTRADVSLRCAALCLKGLRQSTKPTGQQKSKRRIVLERKASFFVTTAAEAISDSDSDTPNERAVAIWLYASRMLTTTPNTFVSGSYGWATLRAVALHVLVLLGVTELSEEMAIKLLSLMSAIQPPKRAVAGKSLSLDAFHAANRGDDSETMDNSGRGSEGFGDTATYIADARSYIADARRAISKDARARSKELFSSQANPSSLLAVAQSKWVDDDPIRPALVPLSDFSSDISNEILALKAIWPTIKIESCSVAQTKLLNQIQNMRMKSAASSLSSASKPLPSSILTKLPVKVTSISIVDPSSTAKLDRVKKKAKPANDDQSSSAMATFFNPYANKKKSKETATLIPIGEEQYISVSFENKLSVSLEIASCKLEFNTKSDIVKAPAAAFTIPPQTKGFAVQFPFLLIEKPNVDDGVIVVTGIYVTTLSRSRYFPIGTASEDGDIIDEEENEIPPPASRYSRRNYDLKSSERRRVRSPRIEIVAPQPSLQLSFARARTPIEEDMVIPVPIMDGEVFCLPKVCIFNDPGMGGLGVIEDLKITAHGLPGYGEVCLFDLAKSSYTQTGEKQDRLPQGSNQPILMTAVCSGMDRSALNSSSKKQDASSISICLTAAPDMGSVTDGCTVTIKFRYRGPAPSDTMEVWRSREIQIGILRMKGPRISSLAFRPDLSWDSGYTELCKTLALDPKRERQLSVNVCSKSVVVLAMIANEAQFPIVVTGFDSHTMTSLTIPANVSIRLPITVKKIDRKGSIMEQLTAATRLKWVADITSKDDASSNNGSEDTGGPMVAMNRRMNEGYMEVPFHCVQNIVDENPLFLSRVGDAPCTISVQVDQPSTVVGKQVIVSVSVTFEKWAEESGIGACLQFCCSKKESETGTREVLSPIRSNSPSPKNDFVWIGHISKALKAKAEPKPSSTGRLIFLNPGQYIVSACLVVDGTHSWLAEKVAHVDVQNS